MVKWQIFIKERFHPLSYIPMIVLFTWVNGYYAQTITQASWTVGQFLVVLAIMFSFFFRMRLFDEIKDFEVDLKINPTRPLARGLLQINEVKKMLILLCLLELILSWQMGLIPFLVHAAVMGYSLLMYEEFFVGDELRPHLTTYAVTHTFVSALLALSIVTLLTGRSPNFLTAKDWFFLLMNWSAFNLFEFARKTFSADEERHGVASYSNIFGTSGAYFLSISQALIGLVLIYLNGVIPLVWITGAVTLYIAASSTYFLKPNKRSAQVFRLASSLYLLIHYIALAFSFGVQT